MRSGASLIVSRPLKTNRCLTFDFQGYICVNFLDDIEDYDDHLRELCDAPLRGTLPEHSLAGRPMDQRTATVGDLHQGFSQAAAQTFCSCL